MGWKAVQAYAMIKQINSKQTLLEICEARMRKLGMIEQRINLDARRYKEVTYGAF